MSRCEHKRVSSAPMSGICLDCGHDVMVEEVEEFLRNNPPARTALEGKAE